MNELMPVFTQKADCQDCYKCVRECPVKAIKIENNSAAIIEDLCIHCGRCVQVCPVGAKKVRDDIDHVRQLFNLGRKVYVSLAPSWKVEFTGLEKSQIIDSLMKLGFAGVSETALGAQEVSSHIASFLNNSSGKIFLSSACPTVVEMIYKYHPEYSDYVTPLFSPAVSHAYLLKETFGNEIDVVFIGPCVGKKTESDRHQDFLSCSLTFEDLHKWLEREGVVPESFARSSGSDFVPKSASEGGLYPIDGGMITGIKEGCTKDNSEFMCFSGISAINSALKEIENFRSGKNLFIELMACPGGCVNGPLMRNENATARKNSKIVNSVEYEKNLVPRVPTLDISTEFYILPIEKHRYSESRIQSALRKIGKFTSRDELNCGSCGYDSCRDFGIALLDGKAQENMCVSFMRKLASKKANALIRTMPAGVVIVNSDLSIIECNRRFASIFGSDTEMVFDASPGMEGAGIQKIIPFFKAFKKVLVTGEDWLDKDISYNDKQLNVSIFTIEKHRVVGAVIQDIQVPHVRRDQVVKRVEDVINLNLQTVQKIAYLLGENASETEIMLNGVLEAFGQKATEIEEIKNVS